MDCCDKMTFDDERLKEIVLRKDADYIWAFNQITDETVLKELALSDDEQISIMAVNSISNQEILAEIALNDAHPVIKLYALRNIEDDDFFEEISGLVDDDFVRKNIDDVKFERGFRKIQVMGLS